MAFLGLIPDTGGQDIKMKMTPEQAKREATGRALSLIGGTITMVGGMLILSNNPIFRREAEGVWADMPPEIRKNKAAVVLLIGLGGAALMYRILSKQTKRRLDI